MNIDDLQTAILGKDPDGVVAALANWNEDDRAAAIEPYNLLMTALGFEDRVIKPCSFQPEDALVKAKRTELDIQPMSRRERNIDYEMYYVAWLAQYGIVDLSQCGRFPVAPDNELRSAQVMADRRPPWFAKWYESVTNRESRNLSALSWSYLYGHQLVTADDFPSVAPRFSADLPAAFEADADAVKKVLREIPACRELLYQVFDDAYQLFCGKAWTPLIAWLSKEDLLDQTRFLQAAVDALHNPHNQTERNGCVQMAKAAAADADTLTELQPQWLGLLADSQASVAGFAVDQIRKIEQAGKLDAHEAVAALPGIFIHKPKSHVKKAVEMLGRIAKDDALRAEAVDSVSKALMHPNKDVQQAALTVLESHLKPDDPAIQTIELQTDAIAATLRPQVEALLRFDSSRAAGGKTTSTTKAAATAAAQAEASSAPLTMDLKEFQQRADRLPPAVAERLRLQAALEAAEHAQMDQHCQWSTRDMRVLGTAERIVPIDSVEELIDVTAAAVEKCDCPDTPDRILSAITRLYRERPKSFDSMTKSLIKRACAHISERPYRGIVGGFLGTPFSLIIGAWLGVEADEEDYHYLSGPIQHYLIAVEQRIRAGTIYPLVSESTHQGGWIEPTLWVDRLQHAQQTEVELLEDDLLRSCLRLTPDGRPAAIEKAQSLNKPLRAIALAALGGDVQIDDSWSPPVWIAALRARDPWIELSRELPPEDQHVITEQIAKLPDVVYPADYQWRVREPKKSRSFFGSDRGLVDASPMPDADQPSAAPDDVLGMLMDADQAGGDIMARLSELAAAEKEALAAGGFFTAQLHQMRCCPAPAFAYGYLATQWPMKLDWYWNLATIGLSRRVDSKSSVDEPYGQFLLPLLQQDRPLTLMAARALWMATVSKDETARSLAIECWIALAGDDRCDTAMLVQAWGDVGAAGWVKLNRVGEALSEVAAVSPVHAWVVASVLQGYLLTCDPLPKDVAKLLDPLEECCQLLGRSVAPELAERLQGVKTGKAKPLAKSLRERMDTPTAARESAILAAIEARLARAERFAGA